MAVTGCSRRGKINTTQGRREERESQTPGADGAGGGGEGAADDDDDTPVLRNLILYKRDSSNGEGRRFRDEEKIEVRK